MCVCVYIYRERYYVGARTKGPLRTFKEWYLDKFTDAFAEDLDQIRVQVVVSFTY